MKVLVTFAIEAEFTRWRERHDFRASDEGGDPAAYAVEIGGMGVTVGLTGIGPEPASKKISNFSAGALNDICISSGFAGALRADHHVGDILAAREVIAEDGRAQTLGREVKSTQRLLDIAERCGAKVVERFYSSATTVQTAKEKAVLSGMAAAVEMESFEVLAGARAWMKEGLAVRAISDAAGEDLPVDFNRVITEEGQLSMPRLAGQVIKKPSAIPGLIRLGRQSSEAAKRLADFLDAFILALVEAQQKVAAGQGAQ
jgi:nucleoside phosphorylase